MTAVEAVDKLVTDNILKFCGRDNCPDRNEFRRNALYKEEVAEVFTDYLEDLTELFAHYTRNVAGSHEKLNYIEEEDWETIVKKGGVLSPVRARPPCGALLSGEEVQVLLTMRPYVSNCRSLQFERLALFTPGAACGLRTRCATCAAPRQCTLWTCWRRCCVPPP